MNLRARYLNKTFTGVPFSLLNTTILAGGFDPYKVGVYSPDLVFDFENEFYRTNNRKTTFTNAITHTRASNATMVDSDGLLKWAPHNIVTDSEDFSSWAISDATITANAVTAPDGTVTADKLVEDSGSVVAPRVLQSPTVAGSSEYTQGLWVKSAGDDRGVRLTLGGSGFGTTSVFFNPDTGTITSGSFDVTDFGDGWYFLSFSNNTTASGGSSTIAITLTDAADSETMSYTGDGSSGIYIWGAHLYRSDLGGMVNNPDRGDTYVPTTSSAVYLPRRGHHVYNGSEWVNEGLLVESEARTQLLHTTDSLVTQSHTVTAVPHTLHFTGTGTVTLSGASTAGPLVGTGTGEENRVYLTFTPTAASLTLTVSGTVTDAQLEVGSTPSSYIPNLAGSGTVARATESLTVPSAKLPWPTPNVIGPEMVTNGTFDTDTSGWSADGDGTIAVNSGALQYTGTAAGPTFMTVSTSENLTLTSGAVYRITFDVVEITPSNEMRVQLGGGNNALVGITTAGSYEAVVVALSASEPLIFGIVGGLAGETFTIDNVSVREIDPLALSIQMQGRVTYADTGDVRDAMLLQWALDGDNKILWQDVNKNLQIVQEENGNFSFTSSVSFFSDGINIPYNIAARHGSTFINGAVDGTALTAGTTPTALPDLETTDLSLASDYMGTVKLYRMFANDLGDSGIEEASS